MVIKLWLLNYHDNEKFIEKNQLSVPSKPLTNKSIQCSNNIRTM